MKFQIGDSVSFINEKQEGIVKKILPDNMVVVEIEDGFEIPVRENELLKISIAQSEVTEKSHKQELPTIHDNISLLDICPENTAIIAAVPDAAGEVLTGPLTYYLINRTGYDLLHAFYCRSEKEWRGLFRGISEPDSCMELFHFKREDLIDIHAFLFQGLLFTANTLLQVSTIRKEFSVLLPELKNARKEINGMAAFAATVTVFSESTLEELPLKDLILKYQIDKPTHQSSNLNPITQSVKHPGKYGILENEKEVDLHIEELVSDISGLSNAEMMEIQLRQFAIEMDYAIKNHFKKLILIHGVGNGKLKSAIRKELRNYPDVAFKDADSRNYGQGATEVLFI